MVRLMKERFTNLSEKIKIYERIEKEIDDALVFAKESPYPDPDEKSFSNVFKNENINQDI